MLPYNLYYFQMSDLHIVLVDCSCDDRTARAGDALVGRPAFSDSSDEPQCERVGLEDGRTLHVTYMPFVSLHQLSDAFSSGNGTDVVLKRARKHLAHIVDYHITWSYTEYIDPGFTEAEQRSQELEKQVIELKKHVQIETAEVRRQTTELDETNTRKTTEMSQQVELRFTELKQKLFEADEAHTRETREMWQRVNNQVTELIQKLQEADEAHTRETREMSQQVDNLVYRVKTKATRGR